MAKPAARAYSRYSREAATLFGMLIQEARIARKWTVAEVAERAGMSRGLVHRIESGDMGCSIGAVFEVAAIVGVRLFDAEPGAINRHLTTSRETLALLPKSVRRSQPVVKDDF
jgi:transcriptional regulator with XRE-family HTH domain